MADRDIKHPKNLPNWAAHEVILEMAKSGAFNFDSGATAVTGAHRGDAIVAVHKKIADYYRSLEDD